MSHAPINRYALAQPRQTAIKKPLVKAFKTVDGSFHQINTYTPYTIEVDLHTSSRQTSSITHPEQSSATLRTRRDIFLVPL